MRNFKNGKKTASFASDLSFANIKSDVWFSFYAKNTRKYESWLIFSRNDMYLESVP